LSRAQNGYIIRPSLSNRSSFCLILFVILLISLTAAAVAGTLLLKADLAEFIKDASGVK
jgi:hypothetical protein